MNGWYVYILRGDNDKLYKGITNNLEKRLRQHELGQSNTTKNMGRLSLIHVEICQSRSEARVVEKIFKSGYGREVLKELVELDEPEC